MASLHVGYFVRLALWALHAIRPAQLSNVCAALIVSAVPMYHRKQINRASHLFHKVTMPKKKQPKHATEMTTEEAARAVFHPRVLRQAKRHIKRLNAGGKLRKSTK